MGKPLDRLKRKMIIENLWLLVLRMLRDGEVIGYEIRDRIKKQYGFWCGNVTAYKVLYLLENEGYVISTKKGGKVYYKATKAGIKELADGEKFLKGFIGNK